MFKGIKKTYYRAGAFMTLGMLGTTSSAHATAPAGNESFSTIAQNITTAVGDVPGMISGISYLVGSLLGVLGIMKIKDHVENPGNTPLKDGAIRLTAGGALFALPIIFESMLGSVDTETRGAANVQAKIKKVQFNAE